MEAVTGSVMKEIDSYTCSNITPSIELMELAGTKMAEGINRHYGFRKALLLCGSSGNGGDAFVVGRKLIETLHVVDAFVISSKLSDDCKKNKEEFIGHIFTELPDLDKYDLIIDGLIGFGLKSRLRDNYIDVINRVNNSGKKIVALDIPTGIDATNGLSYGAYIKADWCFTIEYPKTGLFLNDGLDSYKHLEVLEIGIKKTIDTIHIGKKEDYLNVFPERLRNSNKGSYGKAGVIAGSVKYPGASLICYNALDQFQMGIGYSYLYIPSVLYKIYALRHPEIIVEQLASNDGHIGYDEKSLRKVLSLDSISIGMGMDVSIDLYNTIKFLLLNYEGTLIIDADALNTIAKYGVDVLKNKKCRVILTPHIKEMERISGIDKNDILADSLSIAKDFAKKYDVTLILKSASSVITNGNDIMISSFGNSGLAKGGSGDTLSGILSGLAAYLKEDTYLIARLGAYILGRAAEYAAYKIPEECMSPMDVSNEIKNVIKELK